MPCSSRIISEMQPEIHTMETCKVDSWAEIPDHYKPFSRRLNKVLDDIVLSPAERDQYVKQVKIGENLMSLVQSLSLVKNLEELKWEDGFLCPMSTYICGSKCEGTTTLGLHSDTDHVSVLGNCPVVTNILDAEQYQDSRLLVQDPHTPAGYAKLQLVDRGVPWFEPNIDHKYCKSDAKCRVVDRSDVKEFHNIPFVHYHGPAATTDVLPEYFLTSDNVVAFRCKTWPDCAIEWLTRQRHHNWPTQEQIEKCKTLGCFFVRIGHPNSKEKDLEMRLSFSLQERLLVTDFNSVQLKCYVLLKMIKRERIHATLGENSLTSYHFKTCMLYMIENNPAEFWAEDNLLACLHSILYKMLRYVESMECPNYFIPNENMFEGRLSRQLQVQLMDLLRILLSDGFNFLLDIKCDMLGERLQAAFFFEDLPYISEYSQDILEGISANTILVSMLSRNPILKLCEDKHSHLCFWRLYRLKSLLERSQIAAEHNSEAHSFIISGIDIMLMSILIALAKYLSKSSRFTFTLLSEKWDAPSFDIWRSELKLKQASLMYMLGHSKVSLDILVTFEDQIRNQTSFCSCKCCMSNMADFAEKFKVDLLATLQSASEVIYHRLIVPCLAFLPAERDLTPLALCYEMNRTFMYPPEGKTALHNWTVVDDKDWHKWAVVDGKVLLYFLLYLNHQQLGMEENAAVDIDNIRRLIQTDELLGHRETAYNLLGWIYKEKGFVIKAIECFQESLSIKPTHNAALWQLACVLCAEVRVL